jgi:NAD(P)-dependent dehydrogenase (short-subunit alcohol dehydrogenase family)
VTSGSAAASGALRGVTALVTGGGSGIGRAVVDAYLAAGARVVVIDRDAEAIGRLQRTLPASAAVAAAADVLETGRLAELLADVAADGFAINHVTTCAGIHDQHVALAELGAALPDAFAELFATNVLSVLSTVATAQPALTREHGSVTVTLSEAAYAPRGGGILYTASKWALRGVVERLARELAPEVRVNGVAPGGTAGTRLRGVRALGQHQRADQITGRAERIARSTLLQVLPGPQDHAGAYVYLASPVLARVVTGTVIRTDGGA